MKQQIILLEGADKTGKTTLGKELSARLGIPYFKYTNEHNYWREGKFKEALEYDQTYLLELLKQTGHSMIIDRSWPSEYVYSKIFNRETNFDLLAMLDAEYALLGAMIVITMRKSVCNWEKDELVSQCQSIAIQNEYQSFARHSSCNSISIYTDRWKDKIHDEALEVACHLNYNFPFKCIIG